MTNLLAALHSQGRYFSGGFRTRRYRANLSRYEPHQGDQERARRVRQAERLEVFGNRYTRRLMERHPGMPLALAKRLAASG